MDIIRLRTLLRLFLMAKREMPVPTLYIGRINSPAILSTIVSLVIIDQTSTFVFLGLAYRSKSTRRRTDETDA